MSLSANYTFVGKGNWSLDGVGGQATGGGVVSSIVPEGSQVEAAFLYGTSYGNGLVTSVQLSRGSDDITVGGFAGLGLTAGSQGLQAFRADITAFVREAIGDGDATPFDFNLSGIVGSGVDGFTLVVVYSNSDESTRTISLLDGFSNPSGDAFSLDFAEPVDTTRPGFEAQMSLGIGFGFQGTDQFSTVTVDGRQLTASAGGADDGAEANGGLVTIGGIGDSTANPNPAAPPDGDDRIDDELYDLAQGNVVDATPFLANGASGINVTTANPSNNDNIFFAGFNITAIVAVDTDENDAPVPVGDAVSLFENNTISFNVLSNDFDPDNGDTFAITAIDTSGLKGTLTDIGNGNFSYDPNGEFSELGEGDSAITSFTYTISDGEETSSATVTITVDGVDDDGPTDPGPQIPVCYTLTRFGTQNGALSADQVLAGPAGANSFYFDPSADTGDDRITNFEAVDILVTNSRLRDGNGDGIIAFGANGILDFDALSSQNTVAIDGVSALRLLGEACEGVSVYADAAVRPFGAMEGTLSDDVLVGRISNNISDVFFFDTALGLDLGKDTITGFGASDILVTTTKIRDNNGDNIIGFGKGALLDLPGVEGGTVGISNNMGMAIRSLEYDGQVERDGVAYYVYSTIGSAAGVDVLG